MHNHLYVEVEKDARVGSGGQWWAVVGSGGQWWAVVGSGMFVCNQVVPYTLYQTEETMQAHLHFGTCVVRFQHSEHMHTDVRPGCCMS